MLELMIVSLALLGGSLIAQPAMARARRAGGRRGVSPTIMRSALPCGLHRTRVSEMRAIRGRAGDWCRDGSFPRAPDRLLEQRGETIRLVP
jgi:hypothetical protein